jgi:hypothetical protein
MDFCQNIRSWFCTVSSAAFLRNRINHSLRLSPGSLAINSKRRLAVKLLKGLSGTQITPSYHQLPVGHVREFLVVP